jgi:hypothetical protein
MTTSRSTMAVSSACTMCSIQTIVTPRARIAGQVSAAARATSRSVRPPAISSSSSSFGLGGQRPRQLQALAVQQRELGARRVAPPRQTALLDRIGGAIECLVATQSGTETRCDERGLEHAHAVKRTRHLEGAADARGAAPFGRHGGDVVPAPGDTPGVGRDLAGDQREQRRLARAVGADDADDLALTQGEREVVDDLQAAIALAQAFDREHAARFRVPRAVSPVIAPGCAVHCRCW